MTMRAVLQTIAPMPEGGTRQDGDVLPFTRVRVIGPSMEPAVQKGEWWLVRRTRAVEPGDVVAMGTPAGVGWAREPSVWLKAGDRVEVDIERIGRLQNTVQDEAGA